MVNNDNWGIFWKIANREVSCAANNEFQISVAVNMLFGELLLSQEKKCCFTLFLILSKIIAVCSASNKRVLEMY